MRFPIAPRTLRIAAVVYAVKTLLVGLAWLAIPDLPQRAATHVEKAWQRLAVGGP